ncbi:MAG: hypothetical protein MJ070_06550 [Lachnospiraceae bacterium]|nr:hypothetical protein [Lachnospiraceae bacterium]
MKFYDRHEERTGVQEASPYNPRNDTQCDFVMVYGIHNLKERIAEWRKHGYVIHLMTGVAWGEYQDYLYGKFDGIDHHDEGQRNSRAEINHGVDVPYMCPSVAFSRYLTEKLKNAVDCGVEAIHLEEPEYWAAAGYSEAFKREWEIFYREPWQDQASSPDAAYRSAKLKQYLYRRMLDRLCSELKEYAMVRYGRRLRFYVPTHSLINYSAWQIVSPESSLIDLPGVDGYIAQIWTGTARTGNFYEGRHAERTFETAFLEYGIEQELVRGTDRKMWLLHDPVEDDPHHTWRDYRDNYYRTVTASLMHPGISTYEVAPWPARVFSGAYPSESGNGREPMPEAYRTNLMNVMHILRDMDQPDAAWRGGRTEVGLLLADSAMFQRVRPDLIPPPGKPDEEPSEELVAARKRFNHHQAFSAFYGLALPLLKHGLSVRPVQLDNVRRLPGYLSPYRVLVLSYEYMKPDYPDIHNAIAEWVKNGGVLVYVGNGTDPFHTVRAWWNQNGGDYKNPAEHLFEACGLGRTPEAGIHRVGKGVLAFLDTDPIALSDSTEAADSYRAFVRSGMEAGGVNWTPTAAMIMDRGPYVVTSILSETPFSKDETLKGTYIDLFDDKLPVLTDPTLKVGSVGLWYNVDKIDRTVPADHICAAARIEKWHATARSVSFTAIGPEGCTCTARIAVRRAPLTVTAAVKDEETPISFEYDEKSKTVLLTFMNDPAGVAVKMKFIK